MTVAGNSHDTTHAILESPARIGWRSDVTPPTDVACRFLDWPFLPDSDGDADHHISVAQEHGPEIAVAPDVTSDRGLNTSLQVANALNEHAETVVVVPKSVRPERVPDRYRVGIPAAGYGGGTPWSLWEYRDCPETHILGGGPARQQRIAHHLPTVESVDTSALSKICRFGEWDGGTQDAEHKDYRERLRSSLINYHYALQQL